jgi:hypothetical protein
MSPAADARAIPSQSNRSADVWRIRVGAARADGEGTMMKSVTWDIHRRRAGADCRRTSAGVVGAGLVALALGASCISPDVAVGENYASFALTNPLSMVRENEIVEIPITEVRSRFRAFDEKDFSVHLLPSNWYPDQGDPMLPTDPPPELPAQVIDSDLDGSLDTLLVICDFAAGEKRFVSVASPRFSRRAKKSGPRVDGGLWTRETITREAGTLKSAGKYVEVSSAVLDTAHTKGDGLYQCGGPVFETETCAWRILFDSRMCLDAIGKRERGLLLNDSNKAFVTDALDLGSTPWGGSLFGDCEGLGAGTFGRSEKGTFVPMAGFDSAQYRMVKDGPAAIESEMLVLGAKLGPESYDLRWRIRQYAGTRLLRHDVNLSRTGHGLAFAMNGAGEHKQTPSGQLGALRVSSWVPAKLAAGGNVGLGLLASGRSVNGAIKSPPDAIGIEFDSSFRNFTFWTLAAWDHEPAGLRSAQDFQKEIDDVAARLNSPIRLVNLAKDIRN